MKPEMPLTALVLAIILMMVLPLPTPLLDAMIGVNLSIAVLLIVTVLHLQAPLALSSFPGILLLTTLFRLALAVSTTRLILLNGDAGHIVSTFGQFVVGGNLVVGLTVFLILTIVQFIVVTKGAERVAEVGARFSLDALPGKQMAIDGDLRAGVIDGEAATQRREMLGRESQFYGAMDGALKFVKGDAIAGLLIVVVNLIGGIAIGVIQRGMTFSQAASMYSVLTIGDGLVSQLPSLLVSIAAGIVVTRVADPSTKSSAGQDITKQIIADPRSVVIAALGIIAFGFTPGMPGIVFDCIGGALLLVVVVGRRMRAAAARAGAAAGATAAVKKPMKDVGTATGLSFSLPLEVQLGQVLAKRYTPTALAECLQRVRQEVAAKTGVPIPQIGWRIHEAAPDEGYRLSIYEVPIAQGELTAGRALISAVSFDRLDGLGIPYQEIALGQSRSCTALVSEADAIRLAQLGESVLRDLDVLAHHLRNVLNARVAMMVGVQEAHDLLALLERDYPDLVQELRRLMPDQRLAEVLQRLVSEGVSIRNLRAIVESLAQWAPREKDVVVLAEYARLALSSQITHQWSGGTGVLSAYLLSPQIEDMVREAIRQTSATNYLALDPAASGEIVAATAAEIAAYGDRPETAIVLTSMEIRRYVRKVLETELPDIAVLAYQEVTFDVEIEPIGRIELPQTSKWASAGVGGSTHESTHSSPIMDEEEHVQAIGSR